MLIALAVSCIWFTLAACLVFAFGWARGIVDAFLVLFIVSCWLVLHVNKRVN
jgi:hypothetical protein